MSDAKEEAPKPVKVRATFLGFYGHQRRHPGAEFFISGEEYKSGPLKGKLQEFSDTWMEIVDEDESELPKKKGKPTPKREPKAEAPSASKEVI